MTIRHMLQFQHFTPIKKAMNHFFAKFASVSDMSSRSTALSPLLWMLSLLASATTITGVTTGAGFLLYLFATLLSVVVILTMGAFIYFAINNPDALRSERYTISKIALEKTQIGDSDSGTQDNSLNIMQNIDSERDF